MWLASKDVFKKMQESCEGKGGNTSKQHVILKLFLGTHRRWPASAFTPRKTEMPRRILKEIIFSWRIGCTSYPSSLLCHSNRFAKRRSLWSWIYRFERMENLSWMRMTLLRSQLVIPVIQVLKISCWHTSFPMRIFLKSAIKCVQTSRKVKASVILLVQYAAREKNHQWFYSL